MSEQGNSSSIDVDKIRPIFEKVILDLNSKSSQNHQIVRWYFNLVIAVIVLGLGVFIGAYKITSASEVESALTIAKGTLNSELHKFDERLDSTKKDLYTKADMYDGIVFHVTSGMADDFREAYISSKQIRSMDSLLFKKTSFEVGGFIQAPKSRDRISSYIDSAASKYFNKVETTLIKSLKTSNYDLYNPDLLDCFWFIGISKNPSEHLLELAKLFGDRK